MSEGGGGEVRGAEAKKKAEGRRRGRKRAVASEIS